MLIDMAWIQKNKKSRSEEDRRKERSKVYNTSRWRQLRLFKLQTSPCCERCGSIDDLQVHHKVSPFDGYFSAQRFDELAFGLDNLETLCRDCHNAEHNKKGAEE